MLAKEYKLKKKNDFQKVFDKGRFYQDDFIRIKFIKNNLSIPRFAFIIGLKISKKAVQRNKIKRRLEEIIRLELMNFRPGFDIIVMPTPEILNKNYQEIKQKLINLLKKGGLIKWKS